MASRARPSLLPQCTSCIGRVTRPVWDAWGPLQQTRNKSKAAREAERNIVVKLLQDVPRFGRAGSYIPINPALMRNRWFPSRIADYIPAIRLKQMKAQGVDMTRDSTYGVRANLAEIEEDGDIVHQPRHYVRPIEVDLLSAERSMELLNTFVPPTIDFAREAIEQEATPTGRQGASSAADIMTAIASKSKPTPDGIYGSVSTADVVATLKAALAHNDEAARVLVSESDVRFMVENEEDDTSRVKQLGTFKVEIQVPGAEGPLVRNIRVRAKA